MAVDRLRSLYEQYFMGIEKLEPTVPRKDVDRRIQILRKEQIRNTAQRFRFQMILQRYNTYQTHWQRICREIENGTYKRHVIRAQQRFGDGARRTPAPPPPPAAAQAPAPMPLPAPGARLSADLEAELAELDREFAPMEPGTGDDLLDADFAPPQPDASGRKGGPLWRKVAGPSGATGPGATPPGRVVPGPPRPASPAAPPLPRGAPPPAPARGAPPPAPVRGAPPPAPVAPAGGSPPPPAPSAPIAAPRAPAPRAVPAPPPPRAPAHGGVDLPEERVRQIYAQYIEAKRQLRESTAAITYDSVARSVRESGAKLREKHGKAVDFEVSVKDGKAILKPVLK